MEIHDSTEILEILIHITVIIFSSSCKRKKFHFKDERISFLASDRVTAPWKRPFAP